MGFLPNTNVAPRATRLLVTGGEAKSVLAAVRALRSAGYEPWVAATLKGAYAARSRAVGGVIPVPDPALDREGFVGRVADAAERLSVAAVLPGTESALIALSQNREAFSPSVTLGTPPPETVQRATDKRSLAGLADTVGLATPPTFELYRDELTSRGRDLRYPAVVKPLRSETPTKSGELRHDVPRRIETAGDLQRVLDPIEADAWLVQPYLSGSLYAISGFVWQGEIVCALHQDAHRVWPTDCGSSSYAETVVADHGLEEGVAGLLRAIGWSGIFQVQFLKRGERAYLIDLNPRFYLSLAMTVAAGHDLPAIWVEYLLGRRPKIPPYRVGVRFRDEETDYRALYRAFAAGERWSAIKGLLPRRHTVHAVASVRDPSPTAESFAKLRRLLVRVS